MDSLECYRTKLIGFLRGRKVINHASYKAAMRHVRVALLIFAAFAVAFGARAEPEMNDGVQTDFQKEYYPIMGVNWLQLRQTIRRLTTEPGAPRYEGVTSYTLILKPETGCTADNAWIDMKMVVKVPGLPLATGLEGSSRECWARYERLLADHEEWHVKIARQNARDLLAAIRASSNASCGDLQAIARSRFTRMQKAQNVYDRVSAHGVQQWRAFGLDHNPDLEDAALAGRCEQQ